MAKESDSEQIKHFKQELDELRAKLHEADEDKLAMTKEMRNLFQTLADKDKQMQGKELQMVQLQENNEQLIEKMKSQSREDKYKGEGSMKEELKALEAELIEKDYQTDLLNERLRAAEEQIKSQQVQIEQINAKLKLRREELAAKDNLLNDKFTIKLPTEEQSFSQKLFGPSKAELLEKHLLAAKKASLAHQTHNAFLNMELTRLEKEMRAQLKLREQSIDRLKKETSLLRKRLFNVSKDRGDRSMGGDNSETIEELHSQLEALKKKFFSNYAIVVKMDLTSQGMTCNLNVNQLWDLAQQEGLKEWEDYADWINAKMTQASSKTPANFHGTRKTISFRLN